VTNTVFFLVKTNLLCKPRTTLTGQQQLYPFGLCFLYLIWNFSRWFFVEIGASEVREPCLQESSNNPETKN
jgi:hypothetical protein